jgi:hypothetical protein
MSPKRFVAPLNGSRRPRRAPLLLVLAGLLAALLACATFRAPGDPAPTRLPTITVSVSPPPAPTADVVPSLTLPPSATPTFLPTPSPGPLLVITLTATTTP